MTPQQERFYNDWCAFCYLCEIAALVWGLFGLFVLIFNIGTKWLNMQQYIEKETSESVWGFGQVVALVILALPIISFFEIVTGISSFLNRPIFTIK